MTTSRRNFLKNSTLLISGTALLSKTAISASRPVEIAGTQLVHVSQNGRYFVKGNKGFMPIGHNTFSDFLFVYHWLGTYLPDHELEERFEKLSSNGGNFFRIFIPASLEEGYFKTGKYRTEDVRRLDLIFKLADKYDIYIYVELMMSQYFVDWYSQGCGGLEQWTNSPYNSKNGGPVYFDDSKYTKNDPERERFYARMDMGYSLDNMEYVKAQKAKLKWFVERYGGNPRVMCWGLSNDFPYQSKKPQSVAILKKWLQEMRQYLREIDNNRHMVTLRMSSVAVYPDWIVQEVDFTSVSAYPWSTKYADLESDSYLINISQNGAVNIATWLNYKTKKQVSFVKPVITGEFGYCTERDENGVFLFDSSFEKERGTYYGLWAPLMSGGMPGHKWTGHDGFYSFTKQEYKWLKAISKFCARINWAEFNSRPCEMEIEVKEKTVIPMACRSQDIMIGWLLDSEWIGNKQERKMDINIDLEWASGKKIFLEWIDPQDSSTIKNMYIDVDVKKKEISVPAFEEAIAFVIETI